jgi:lambda family phage portal protein
LLARSWLRDGDVFAQQIMGQVPYLDHGTKVPLSLEMLEADLVPFEYSLPPTIIQGIEMNTWGRPVGYWVLLQPPGDVFQGFAIIPTNMKRIPADRMLHIKCVDRIRQIRGVSVFASCFERLDDLKDYEESERIAAKVAASMAAYIKKGAPEDYPTSQDPDKPLRDLRFRPGMVFDDLLPGEEIGTIDTKRPNPNLLAFRQGQMRGLASGANASYSSIARDYNGTYSSQRQEMVESYSSYATLGAEFTSRIVRPTYKTFVALSIAAGVTKVPSDVYLPSVNDALYVGPQMPWIDPESEAASWVILEAAGYASGPEIIRRRGMNPHDVRAQEKRWRAAAEADGMTFTPMVPQQQASSTSAAVKAALRETNRKGTAS